MYCVIKGCTNPIADAHGYCAKCMMAKPKTNKEELDDLKRRRNDFNKQTDKTIVNNITASLKEAESNLAAKYPKYYKPIPSDWKHIDVYGVHQLFNVQDPSGALQHASKKILLSGVRTGNKSAYKDIQEARDTLNRWLEMNKE